MKKMKNPKDKSMNLDQSNQKRYLTEFDFEVNPIDFFLETSVLESILSVFYPLACIKLPKMEGPGAKRSLNDGLMQLNNNNLPMVYFKSERIRLFLLGPEITSLSQDDLLPNFLMFQMKKLNITSQVENPLTRILVEPSLYHQASNCRMLTVPGSPMEDRQYQVDIVGVSLATGHWQDVEDRNRKPVKPLLRTMSENPALEWNTNVQSLEESSEVVMVPLVYNLNIKILFAPAIVHQKMDNNIYSEILVAGLSSEVNLMSDINFCISLQQLNFMSLFKEEIFSLFHFDSKTEEKKQPKHSDSGLDSNREDESFKSVDNSCLESDKVSIDLLTCTNVPVALHKYEKSKSIMPTEYSQKSTEFQK